jgi:hypothetical protein
VLEELPTEDIHPRIDNDFLSVIVKALMVHAARWDAATCNVLKQITNPNGSMHWEHEREEVTRILGYGRTEIDRVLDCTEGRATLISQLERLNSNETKITPRSAWIAVNSSDLSATTLMVSSKMDGSDPHFDADQSPPTTRHGISKRTMCRRTR